MGIKAKVSNNPYWGIIDLIAPPHPMDEYQKKTNGGVLPLDYTPKSKVLFNYALFANQQAYLNDPTNHEGTLTGLFGASGEHVREIVNSGLTVERGTALVRRLLSGEVSHDDSAVYGVRQALSKMDGDTADLDDGKGEFVIKAPVDENQEGGEQIAP